MNFLGPNINTKVKLIPRSEGKIKSYESCADVRAWSHDVRARDRHLREWIKRDMPICVLPVCTLANFLRTMTCRTRSRVAPRCHPDCKSKVVLESLCKSCQAINECLKCNPNLSKYFVEEELDTTHWPCDRCLDVLKGVKMLWKIIIEKIFGVNLSKSEEFESIKNDWTDSIKSVAKLWEKEIVQQAVFVKDVAPFLSKELNNKGIWKQKSAEKEIPSRIPKPCKTVIKESPCSLKINKVKSPTRSIITQKTRIIQTGKPNCCFPKNCKSSLSSPSKLRRCNSVKVKMADAACNTSDMYKNNDDLTSYKRNVELLQQKCNTQESEMDELRRQNTSLKIELQNFYKKRIDMSVSPPIINVSSKVDITALIPKPFESCIEDDFREKFLNKTDSEMVITMKNYRNERYNHVSLLQVIHKTNVPAVNDEPLIAPSNKSENPIDLLTRVHNTFGEMVKREIRIVTSRQGNNKHDIDAASYNLNSKSAPSCSVFTEASSESNIASF